MVLSSDILLIGLGLIVLILLIVVISLKDKSHRGSKPLIAPLPPDAAPQATPYYLFLDVQTTGLDCDHDRLLEVTYLVTDLHGAQCSRKTIHIKQTDLGTPEACAVHQITVAENQSHGIAERDALVTLVDVLSSFDDVYVVSHHVAFDVRMIASALRRHGMQADDLLDRLQYFCTMRLDIKLLGSKRYRKLADLTQALVGRVADRLIPVMPVSYRHVLQIRLCFFAMQSQYADEAGLEPLEFSDLEVVNEMCPDFSSDGQE